GVLLQPGDRLVRRGSGARAAAARRAVQQRRISLAEDGRGARVPGGLGGAHEAVRGAVDRAPPRLWRAPARFRRLWRSGRATLRAARGAKARPRRRVAGQARADRGRARADLAASEQEFTQSIFRTTGWYPRARPQARRVTS